MNHSSSHLLPHAPLEPQTHPAPRARHATTCLPNLLVGHNVSVLRVLAALVHVAVVVPVVAVHVLRDQSLYAMLACSLK